MNELQGENRLPSIHTLKLFSNMDKKIDDLKKLMSDLRIDIAKLPEKVFEKCDKRYASKLAERVIFGMVGVILTTVLMAIIYLILK